MSIYLSLYNNICSNRKQLISEWIPGSGLHRHHIIPKHMGGADEDSNYTYLLVREHVIAHFLLWKIYKNPNDLRAMHMLGANLTTQQRRITGEYCRDNKLGFFGAPAEKRTEWGLKGYNAQKSSIKANTFYWWSTKEGQLERASMGGKIGGRKQADQKIGIHDPQIQLKAASLGGKAHRGKRCMYKPGDISFKRIKTEYIQKHLSEGYIFGSPIPPKNQYSS